MATRIGEVESDSEELSEKEYKARLSELPPSAKLVAKMLELDDSLTKSDLVEETLLPERTVRYALDRLEESELVVSRYSLADARKQVYSLRAA